MGVSSGRCSSPAWTAKRGGRSRRRRTTGRRQLSLSSERMGLLRLGVCALTPHIGSPLRRRLLPGLRPAPPCRSEWRRGRGCGVHSGPSHADLGSRTTTAHPASRRGRPRRAFPVSSCLRSLSSVTVAAAALGPLASLVAVDSPSGTGRMGRAPGGVYAGSFLAAAGRAGPVSSSRRSSGTRRP